MAHRFPLLIVVLALLLPAALPAAPSLDEVIDGDVTFHRDGSVTVITASDGAIIHYDSFDVFVNEVVRFVQPGETARVLNRVFGDATRIDGEVTGNGIVYIVNPAGIFIDGEAVVEVGGLVAAAGSISNEDFRAGLDRFELTGAVENRSDDLRARSVALLGRHVSNFGEIHAPEGTIALVAGGRAVLGRIGGRVFVEVDGPSETVPGPGVVQAGRVDAGGGRVVFAVGDHYSAAINHAGVTRGGDVELRGGDGGTVLVQGAIDASGDARGGSIRVIGDRVALVGATLDASGETGGGSVHVGGRLRGEGDSARRTFVDGDSVLRADALVRGDGGEVVVWGDEAAVFRGTLSARGGADGGDGGFAEISSLGLLSASGSVDLGAPAGASGTLLFDPQDIVVEGGTADGDDDPDASDTTLDPAAILFDDDLGSDPFVIHESEIEGTDANIVLEARHSITTAGTFDNDAGGEGVGVVVLMAGNDLTLRTRNAEGDDAGSSMGAGIDLGDTDWVASGGDITIAAGTSGDAVTADVSVGDLTSGGGAVDVSTSTGDVTVGAIDSSGADGDVGGDAGVVDVRADVAGDVTVGSVDASGGEGTTGAGGAGADVTIVAVDGAVDVASIDASGGAGGSDGGAGGMIGVGAGDEDGSGTSSVVIGGDLVSRGGAGAGGAGGAGGVVDVRTLATPGDATMGGGPVTVLGSVDASGGDGTGEGGAGGDVTLAAPASGGISVGDVRVRGGEGDGDASGDGEAGGAGGSIAIQNVVGDVAVGDLDASGGDGGTGGDAGAVLVLGSGSGDVSVGTVRAVGGVGATGAGGRGALDPNLPGVFLASVDGAVTTGALDVSGGDGATTGGSGGTASVESGDEDGSGTSSVAIDGDILARGGEGAGGAGGAGGGIGVFANAAPQDPPMMGEEPADPMGGGPITVAGNIDVAGGDGTGSGGAGGGVTIASAASGDIVLADVSARGGNADTDGMGDAEAGGGGGAISIDSDDGSIAAGTLDVSGGDGSTDAMDLPEGSRGRAGSIGVFAGNVGTGDLTLGPVSAVDGDGVGVAGPDAFGRVDVGAAGDVVFTGGASHVVSTENVRIRAGESLVLADGVVHVDMGDGDPGFLVVQAGNGIGTEASPLNLRNAERIAAGVTTSGGIHIRQVEGGDLLLTGGQLPSGMDDPFASTDAVAIVAGDGDIDVENEVGDVLLFGDVRTSVDGGATGSIRLAASGMDGSVRFAASGAAVDSAGEALIDAPLLLISDGVVNAVGDVTFAGAIDGVDPTTRNLTAGSETGVVRFQGDVGSGFELRNLTVEGDTLLDPSSGSSMSFDALQTLDFAGDVTADGATSLALVAGNGVRFGGDVGSAGNVTGLSLDTPQVVFDGDGAQSVLAGAGGIGFDTPDGLPAPPQLASVGKAGGDLRLESVGGDVDFGPNHKLTVDGIAELVGDSVTVGDVNALELHVDAATAFRVRAREPGTFLSPGIGAVPDGGTDLFANVMTTTLAPEVVGAGPAPQILTQSGAVGGAGAGALPVQSLSREIVSGDLVEVGPDGRTFFDLGVAVSDPGNEVEPDPAPVAPLLPALPGEEAAAGSAQPPSAEDVLAFLRCADAAPEDARACAPAPGSPLDSERGEDLAARYRRLFGSAPEAGAAQRLLRSDVPERSSVLRDLVTFLAQLRLLGLPEGEYERLRDRLLEQAVGAERRETLLADVRSHGRGLPL